MNHAAPSAVSPGRLRPYGRAKRRAQAPAICTCQALWPRAFLQRAARSGEITARRTALRLTRRRSPMGPEKSTWKAAAARSRQRLENGTRSHHQRRKEFLWKVEGGRVGNLKIHHAARTVLYCSRAGATRPKAGSETSWKIKIKTTVRRRTSGVRVGAPFLFTHKWIGCWRLTAECIEFWRKSDEKKPCAHRLTRLTLLIRRRGTEARVLLALTLQSISLPWLPKNCP
jgi:hypothetical protein